MRDLDCIVGGLLRIERPSFENAEGLLKMQISYITSGNSLLAFSSSLL